MRNGAQWTETDYNQTPKDFVFVPSVLPNELRFTFYEGFVQLDEGF